MNTRTIGKILGAAGLVLLLSSGFTWLITSGSAALAGAKAASGVVLIGIFFFTNWEGMGQFASKRSSLFVLSSAVMTLSVLAGLSAINYVAAKKNKAWDLTSKKIYTLAPQTQTALKDLKEKVKAIGFLAAKDPAYEPLENLLQRYADETPERFEYAFKDPMKHPDLTAKYNVKQGASTVVLVRGEGEMQTQTSLNIISEQELTNALLKLNAGGEQKVCVVAGHGEFPLEPQPGQPGTSLSELKQSLAQEGYTTEALNLAGQQEVPRDCGLVVVAGSRGAFAEPEVATLQKFLAEGGRLAYFAEMNAEPGLDKLLATYGIQVDPGIVADLRFANRSPYHVVSPFFSEHEVGKLLKGLQMNILLPTVRGLSVLHTPEAEGATATPVLTSSPYAWVESTPNDEPEPNEGEKAGQLPLVVASTRNTASAPNKRFDEGRVVVFGDSELLVDANWGYEPNRNLVMNALAWTSTQVNKVTIRPPDRDISTIDIDDQTMGQLRFFATDLLPLSLLMVGLGIWIARRNQ
ncbi:MAG: GldG family protein [Deltaproteobacteria bacterium]|nr:GldG family protein [Deltaproteobacteria bacterium]